MSIITKGGDRGRTDGPGGFRVEKFDPFVEIVGTLDEANAAIGIARRDTIHFNTKKMLAFVQNKLLDIGAELYLQKDKIREEDVELLESYVYEHESDVHTFVLPNNFIHVSRSLVRRAERQMWAINNPSFRINSISLRFMNRLSDALYAAALLETGNIEYWEKDKEMFPIW